ncbi:hypothetical protein [Pedobacter nyackensis]|nr:hypothetical protein [Pedobacter nyackensis]
MKCKTVLTTNRTVLHMQHLAHRRALHWRRHGLVQAGRLQVHQPYIAGTS